MKWKSGLTALFISACILVVPQVVHAEPMPFTVITETLNIRQQPTIESEVVSTFNIEDEILAEKINDEWSKVFLENGLTAYVNSSYITEKTFPKATITVDKANIRLDANTDSMILTQVVAGEEIEVLETGDWSYVRAGEYLGYIHSELFQMIIFEDVDSIEQDSELVTRAGVNRQADSVIDLAYSLRGTPYVYGSNGPSSFDCSGFVKYVYQNSVGISLPRVSRDQANAGTYVNRSDLLPGDIIAFNTAGGGSNVTHVGIYIGDSNFIHASSGRVMSVTVDSLDSTYYRKAFLHGSRVLQ